MTIASPMLISRAKLLAGMLFIISLFFCSPSIASPEARQNAGVPNKRAAYQLYQVDLLQRSVLTGQATLTSRDAERYCKTLEVLFKSSRVIESALRSGTMREYSIYPEDESTAVEWLQEQLEVSMVEGSEILMLSFPHESASKKEMVGIVKAVSRAFMDEVFFEERLREKKSRDILAQSYQSLHKEILRKDQLLITLLEEQPCVLLPWIAEEVELMKQQIGRLQAEKIDAERRLWEQRMKTLQSEPSEDKGIKELGMIGATYAAIKKDLQKQIDELTQAVKLRSQVSPEHLSRQDELSRLKEIQREVGKQIEYLDIELRRPDALRRAGPVSFVDP